MSWTDSLNAPCGAGCFLTGEEVILHVLDGQS